MGKLLIPALLVCFLGSVLTNLYTFFTYATTLVVLIQLLKKFGKGIALLEVMAFYSCVIYLMVPLLGYSIYTNQDKLTVMWRKTMPVDEATYYSFILPAIIAYLIGLFFMNNLRNRPDEGEHLLDKLQVIKEYLLKRKYISISLICVGLVFFVVKRFLPTSLFFIGNLIYLLTFVGALYIYFQPHFKGKFVVLAGIMGIIFMDALNTGMFTTVFYMTLTIVSFFLIGKKIRFGVKLGFFMVALSGVMILQVVKNAFRSKAWYQFSGSRVELFQNLLVEKTSEFDALFSKQAFFPIYARLNQGWTTALVMRRIPARQPYDGGTSIINSIGASVIPRVLWPDKPQSGGVYNMQHFTGWRIKGWSTNIGPVGEAYGNFGRAGGILFMFFFGWFLGFVYVTIFKKSERLPLLIFWFPLLYFEVMYSMENDTLQAMNSLIKACFFIFVTYKIFPQLFGQRKTITETNT